LLALSVVLCSCGTTGSEVVQKVKYDFGVGEKPEGYVSGAEKVEARLNDVGKTEMKRMNAAGRQGDVVFSEEGPLRGKYYKKVKMYESFRPLEARPISHGGQGEHGFVGLIQYTFRIYEGERKNNRTEAAAASANLRTDVTGRETYRHRFGSGGGWDGAPGERTRD
jgi:ASC-1-like (ASCH) protein